jgi:hypothetical protein
MISKNKIDDNLMTPYSSIKFWWLNLNEKGHLENLSVLGG